MMQLMRKYLYYFNLQYNLPNKLFDKVQVYLLILPNLSFVIPNHISEWAQGYLCDGEWQFCYKR